MKKTITLLLCSFYLHTLNAGLCPVPTVQTAAQELCRWTALPTIQPTNSVADFQAVLNSNNIKKIKKFIKDQSIDINKRSSQNETLLHVAAEENYTSLIEILVAEDVHLDTQDTSGQTPLHKAADNGCQLATTLLLQTGANPHITDKNGNTALHLAAEKKHQPILETFTQELKNKPADFIRLFWAENRMNLTPLGYCMRDELNKIFEFIIENLKDEHTELLDTFFSKELGTRKNRILHVTTSQGFHTLEYLIQKLADKHIPLLYKLLRIKNTSNSTPLHYAGYLEMKSVFDTLRAAFQHTHPYYLQKLLTERNGAKYTPWYILKQGPYPQGIENELETLEEIASLRK